MKEVSLAPVVELEKCIGCGICSKVCPAATIEMTNAKANILLDGCRGCAACEQRCPVYAIKMTKLEKPYKVSVDLSDLNYDDIAALCRKAKLNPEQLVCYCTATRAEEAAAAILKGATTPEAISRATGIRMGCKVECIQPILRLLDAAGITPEPAPGYQRYGLTPTVWDIPEEVKAKYNKRGFYFDEDIRILDKVVAARTEGGKE